ncbi:MAG: GMC family oxidoreductase [Verrucomicrobia bacterium]|nr:GMC family oxidoreductase [Verrucomicrobiota bacterium]MBS0637700.1 GMC family oxidoreductase [Verrucomicrobiota bacterium]
MFIKNSMVTSLLLGFVTAFTNLSASCKDTKYDYIIVGAGTAGAVLARKLSDNHKNKVLVLECGVNHNDDPAVLDTGADGNPKLFTDFWSITYDPQYAEVYAMKVNHPLNYFGYSEGRGWGGSSMHNYTQVHRSVPAKYDQWAILSGNSQWSYSSLLPLMKALETYTPCQTTANYMIRGSSGPIKTTQTLPITSDPLITLLADGTNAGFITDWNDPTDVSTTGLIQMGFSAWQSYSTTGGSPCTLGHRSFAGNEYLSTDVVTPEGKGRHGRQLTITSHAYVSKVLFKGKKAVGVEYICGDEANKVTRAYGKKIILCAGAINSPAILQRSGIGDRALLESLDIDVLVDNPLVGKMVVNPGVTTTVAVPTEALPALQALSNGSANPPLSAPFNYPNDQEVRLLWVGFPVGPGVSVLQTFVYTPHSQGFVNIVDKNPLVKPLVDPGSYNDGPYTTYGTDANLVMAILKQIGQAVGLENMIGPAGGVYEAGDDALWAYATSMDGFYLLDHVSCSCRMGTSIANGVVDGNLNVFGVKNLMVVDNSIQPINTDGAWAAYVVGLRAATILGVPVPPGL